MGDPKLAIIDYSDVLSHASFRDSLLEYVPGYNYSPTRFIKGDSDYTSVITELKQDDPDLIVTTNGYRLSAIRSKLPDVPVVVHFGENRLGIYNERAVTNLTAHVQTGYLTEIDCIDVADEVVFNSAYQRDLMAWQLKDLQGKVDYVSNNTIDKVVSATVLPRLVVGKPGGRKESNLVVWNHRWATDKGIDDLLLIDRALYDSSVDCRIVCTSNVQSTAQKTKITFTGRVLPKDEHLDLLSRATVLLSTSKHETFGISVMEGILSGCCPLLPNRQIYPYLIPEEYHGRCLYSTVDDAVDKLTKILTDSDRVVSLQDHSAIKQFEVQKVAPMYKECFDRWL